MWRGRDDIARPRDGRAVFLGGERIPDVTAFWAFAEPTRRIAATDDLAPEEANPSVTPRGHPQDGPGHSPWRNFG